MNEATQTPRLGPIAVRVPHAGTCDEESVLCVRPSRTPNTFTHTMQVCSLSKTLGPVIPDSFALEHSTVEVSCFEHSSSFISYTQERSCTLQAFTLVLKVLKRVVLVILLSLRRVKW